MATKFGNMVAYNEELPLVKSHDPSVKRPHEVM